MSQQRPGETLYRAQALEARRRIEALPTTMHVTSSWTRATVCGVALALIGAIAASAYVHVPVQISGSGVIVDRSGQLSTSITAAASGFVETLLVRPGHHVIRGQAVARITLPEQSVALAKLKAVAEAVERESQAYDALAEQSRTREAAVSEARIAALDNHIASLDRRVVWLDERAAAEKALQQKGISTEARMIAAMVSVQDAIVARDQARFDRTGIAEASLQADAQREKDALARQLRIDQARLDVSAAEREIEARSVVRSAIDGVVTDVLLHPGAPTATGQPVAVVTAEAGNDVRGIEAAVYVPLAVGKRVAPGDAVLVAPAILREGENDRMRGTVRSVSVTPAPRSVLVATLGSDQLVDLATRQGPVFEVIVAFERDAGAPSGFAWTSGAGPAVALGRGTPLGATITVDRTPLLSLALPAARGLFQHKQAVWTSAAL
jgi:NHLM bacteriocin system secretion protein